MESWVPLFDIFLNSSTPETEASLWLQQSFNASSPTPITTSSFLSFLTKPVHSILVSSSSTSSTNTKRVMFLQTLPDLVQSRILSFLGYDCERFCKRDLCRLATSLLGGTGEIDFWVKRAARNLLDQVSDSNYEWISGLNLDSGEKEEGNGDDFESVPSWLKDAVSTNADDFFLPWLPVSSDEYELNSRGLFSGGYGSEQDSASQVGEDGRDFFKQFYEEMEIDCAANDASPLEEEILNTAAGLKARIMNFESSYKAVTLANEMRELCFEKRGGGHYSFAILGLIEPWKADDEIASVLISNLSNGSEEELAWPAHVLSSIMLPRMLVLEGPASRVLVTAIIDYCKLHQRAAEYALLFPLIMRMEGINNPICDVITRIVKECLHPAHVSAFCQKLLRGGEVEKRFILLPCHWCLLSNELVWTESLFNLFHTILNHNVQLTPDSVDQLVQRIQELAPRFSKSLKFGNFLLCFITKCAVFLKSNKLLLAEAVKQTNTLVTKSILSKLASF